MPSCHLADIVACFHDIMRRHRRTVGEAIKPDLRCTPGSSRSCISRSRFVPGGCRRHADQLPDVAVGILESVSVHEAVLLCFIVGGSSRRYGLAYQIVQLLPAFAGEAEEHLRKNSLAVLFHS